MSETDEKKMFIKNKGNVLFEKINRKKKDK